MQSQVSPSSCLKADLVGRRDECRARGRGWGLPLGGTGPDSFLKQEAEALGKREGLPGDTIWTVDICIVCGGHPKFQDRIFVHSWTSGNLLSPRVPVRPTLGAPAALPRA